MIHLPNKPETDARLMNDHPPFSISAPFYGFYTKRSKQGSTGNHTRGLSHRRPTSYQYGKKGVFLCHLTYNAQAAFCSRYSNIDLVLVSHKSQLLTKPPATRLMLDLGIWQGPN